MKLIHTLALVGLGFFALTGCSKDEVDPNNLVTRISRTEPLTEFDTWLEENLLKPYNINLQYRLNNNELVQDAYITPVEYKKAKQFAYITKHACLEAYDAVTGSQTFVRSLFPKLLVLGGSHLYNLNGTIDQGAAEGGRKISIYGLNNTDLTDFDAISEMFHTMHHEFGHIQNQEKSFSPEYRRITPTLYQGQLWAQYWGEVEGAGNIDRTIREELAANNPGIKAYVEKFTELAAERDALLEEAKSPFFTKQAQLDAKIAEIEQLQADFDATDDGALWKRVNSLVYYLQNKNGYLDLNALRAGFISAYSSASPDEDFVEVQATYIMEDPRTWETLLMIAGPGASAIQQKLAIVRSYLQTEWQIDLDKLRDEVQQRHKGLSKTTLDNL